MSRLLAGADTLEGVDPRQALGAALARAAAAVEALSMLVADVAPAELAGHQATALYLAAVDRLTRVAAVAHGAGLDEHREQLTEELGGQIASVLGFCFDSLAARLRSGEAVDAVLADRGPLLRRALERAGEGAVVVDPAGVLVGSTSPAGDRAQKEARLAKLIDCEVDRRRTEEAAT